MAGVRSVHTTRPRWPTAAATVVVGSPVPPATSSTRMPGARRAVSTSAAVTARVLTATRSPSRSQLGAAVVHWARLRARASFAEGLGMAGGL